MNDSLEVISQVNEFYQQAWDKLVIFGALVVGLFGIVLPFVFSYFQSRITKNFETNFKAAFREEIKNEVFEKLNTEFEEKFNRMNNEFEEKFNTLNKEFEEKTKVINNTFEDRYEILNKSLDKQISVVKALTWHFGGIRESEKSRLKDALRMYNTALKCYIEGEDYVNADNVLTCVNGALLNLDLDTYKELKEDGSIQFNNHISKLTDIGNQEILVSKINATRLAFKKKFNDFENI